MFSTSAERCEDRLSEPEAKEYWQSWESDPSREATKSLKGHKRVLCDVHSDEQHRSYAGREEREEVATGKRLKKGDAAVDEALASVRGAAQDFSDALQGGPMEMHSEPLQNLIAKDQNLESAKIPALGASADAAASCVAPMAPGGPAASAIKQEQGETNGLPIEAHLLESMQMQMWQKWSLEWVAHPTELENRVELINGKLKLNGTDDEIVEGYRAMVKRRLDVANALLSSTTTLLNQEQDAVKSENTNLQGVCDVAPSA